ncbi:MAG TPA: riboflavin synthase, partial [Candidatus Methanoperedens sp.]|nr:riboflavin synthase [Candidatus Methanoperedens sp.]
MFTGLIQEIGAVLGTERRGGYLRLRVGYDAKRGALRPGDSMAVNGVCLTAAALAAGSFTADLSAETQARTTLGRLRPGAKVNLERPVSASDPLGGHVVLGHVDAVGRIRRVRPGAAGLALLVAAPPPVMGLLVPKGSVAVDGVSLTVASLARDGFWLLLIPETVERTTLGARAVGDEVNLEADYLAKLVQRFMERPPAGAGRAAPRV